MSLPSWPPPTGSAARPPASSTNGLAAPVAPWPCRTAPRGAPATHFASNILGFAQIVNEFDDDTLAHHLTGRDF